MLFSLLALAPLVAGHTLMTTLYVDGENQGDGVCIRQNRNHEEATFPISPLANDAMACGYDGETANKRTCPISQNSTLTFKFREWPDGSQGGSIDEGHKGPCAVYMKPVADATASNNAAAGDGWFKIYENTYDEDAGGWCTEKLIANNGFLSVDVPQGLQGGDYLVRTELLALHAAQDDPPDPQFYVGCAQVFLEGSEDGAVPKGITIDKDTYDLGIKGLTYNLYSEPLELPYPSFGPAVYKPDANAKAASAARASSGKQAVQKKGLEPEGCILVRDDWCGFEVPSYSDEEGCWASSKNCWNQTDVCYETAPPTGSKNCKIWENKCSNIDDQCNAGNFNGPPNKGKDLTPKLEGIDGSTAEYSGSISSSQFEGSNDDSSSDSTATASKATATATATETATETETADADAGRESSKKGHCKAKRAH